MKYLADTGRKRTWKNRLFGKCWLNPNSPLIYPFDTQWGWDPFQENEFGDIRVLWRYTIQDFLAPLTEAIRAFTVEAQTLVEAFRQFAEAYRQIQRVSDDV
jgi:hypothetical protein